MYNLDSVLEALVEKSYSFEIAVAGDQNLVLDPEAGSLNRANSAAERRLATFVKEVS